MVKDPFMVLKKEKPCIDVQNGEDYLPKGKQIKPIEYVTKPLADAKWLPPVIVDAAGFLPEGAYIAGGAITDWIAGAHAKDIDFFFSDVGALLQTAKLLENGPRGFPFLGFTMSRKQEQGRWVEYTHPKIGVVLQFVTSHWWKDAKSLLNDFDFTACQFHVSNKEVTFNPQAIEHIDSKQIVINSLKSPRRVIYRLMRYGAKGYSLNAENMAIVVDHMKNWKR